MRTLALDITGAHGSIALAESGKIMAEQEIWSPDGYAHIIFGEIQTLLLSNSWQLHEIECLASASGPGSFTGVRVGLTVAKGLAEALERPIAAVSNLRALSTFGTAEQRAVMIDARRGEIYGAVYNAQLELMHQETVGKLDNWLKLLAGGGYEFIASEAPGAPFEHIRKVTAPKSLAAAVAKCAWMDAQAGRLLSPVEADANYVRRSDAELFWKET